jgi:acetylglutamate kinase
LITRWLALVGKETRFVSGLRYTDEETLEVVRMVLGGLVNGEIVARLGAAGARAVGLTGSDDRLLQATMRDDGTGLVGNVSRVTPRPVETLLEAGYVVVVAPVAVSERGEFLNVNADTAAAEVAAALGARRLVFLTDVQGVSDGTETGARRILPTDEARDLVARGVIDGGMIPKVEACIRVLSAGCAGQIVDGRQPHALLEALVRPAEVGTTVVAA